MKVHRKDRRLKLPLPGDEYYGWKIESLLGKGATGVVYKVSNAEFGIRAMKLLNVENILASPDLLKEVKKRFLREARILSKMKHPGIVLVRNYKNSKEFPFFIMDYIRGIDLKTRLLLKEPLDLVQVCD